MMELEGWVDRYLGGDGIISGDYSMEKSKKMSESPPRSGTPNVRKNQ
jgi:hypothetical protein